MGEMEGGLQGGFPVISREFVLAEARNRRCGFIQGERCTYYICQRCDFAHFFLPLENAKLHRGGKRGDGGETHAFTHPSISHAFVICAHLPHTTFPPVVTNPNSLTFTSIIVPLVSTPSCVYSGFWGFFFTLMIGSWTVTARVGCVTLARL